MSDETVRLIEKTADDLFAAESETARAALAEGAWPERLWQTFAETGLAQAALPEEAGGAGVVAGLAVLRAAGRHAAPIPVAETMVGTLLCHAASIEAPAGPLSVHALPDGAGVGGVTTLPRVPWARFVSTVVVAAPGEGLASCKPVDIGEGANLAGEPRDDVTLAGPPDRFVSCPPEVDGFALMALARAAQLRGAMEHVLAMSVGYAQDRVQFGRPLARFQAIQHYLAEIAGEAAATGAAVDAAPQAGTPFAFAAAKSRASQAAGTVARLAHQVHGAIGYTAEHDLHIWTKRLWAWRDECGNEAHWWQVLGAETARGGGAALWPTMVAASGSAVEEAASGGAVEEAASGSAVEEAASGSAAVEEGGSP
ncbi:MAG: acyl-CoA dehydrogenase [Rhodospirillales bacterium]|nr:acyl-CoA dehydrogenase [Rhodospirillales bacterium]